MWWTDAVWWGRVLSGPKHVANWKECERCESGMESKWTGGRGWMESNKDEKWRQIWRIGKETKQIDGKPREQNNTFDFNVAHQVVVALVSHHINYVDFCQWFSACVRICNAHYLTISLTERAELYEWLLETDFQTLSKISKSPDYFHHPKSIWFVRLKTKWTRLNGYAITTTEWWYQLINIIPPRQSISNRSLAT